MAVLKERLASSESMSAGAFQDSICKPMKIVEVWQNLMKKRYGSVATGSAALDRLVASLTQWVGLQTVSRCAQMRVVLHGESAEKQGIPECWALKNEFDKCQAGGLPSSPNPHRAGSPRRGKREIRKLQSRRAWLKRQPRNRQRRTSVSERIILAASP